MNCPLCGSDVAALAPFPIVGEGSIVFCTDKECPAYQGGLEIKIGIEDVTYLEPVLLDEEGEYVTND